MKKVLVLGAGGQIARWVIEILANNDNVVLTYSFDTPGSSKQLRQRIRMLSRAMCSTKTS